MAFRSTAEAALPHDADRSDAQCPSDSSAVHNIYLVISRNITFKWQNLEAQNPHYLPWQSTIPSTLNFMGAFHMF